MAYKYPTKVGQKVRHQIWGGNYIVESISLDGWCELKQIREDGSESWVGDMITNLEVESDADSR